MIPQRSIPRRRLPPFTFATLFLMGKKVCGPGARALRAKSIGPVISDFGLRISDFFGFLFQSAFRNRHSAIWRRAYRAVPNSEFGMWNSEFLLLFFHSAFRTLHSSFQLPARPKKGGSPHGFCAQSRQWRDFRAGQHLLGEKEDKLGGSGLLAKKIGQSG